MRFILLFPLHLLLIASAAFAEEIKLRPFADGAPELVFNHDVSGILGADDVYTLSFSKFDYASKFKSATPVAAADRAAAYRNALEEYTPDEIAMLRGHFQQVFAKMKGMNVKLPETLHIFSERTIESGAAYTRANTICMPKHIVAMAAPEQLRDLAAHEMFHVISRYNPALRDPVYATLGFRPVGRLVLTGELATRTIANPDAPENTHAITCTLRGESLLLMPILHSKRDFPRGARSFFPFLNDDLIAVEIRDGKPAALERDGNPLIVKKDQLDDFFTQVGRNTGYTFHPEETSADHFKQLLFWNIDELPNPEKIHALDAILRK